MAKINRKYKDRLFKFIFGNPDNKEWTLLLYNAVNNTHYSDADMIELNTIEDAVYMSMKNDVSFIIDDTMNFYEQQSTFNPNMPMRFLIYIGMAYSRFIEESKNYFEFSSRQQKAPLPKCICFYNGTTDKEDRIVLKLTDAFDSDKESDVEVKVTMININFGHNKELLDACKPLYEYSWFIDRIRCGNTSKEKMIEAVNNALEDMPDNFLIKPFLLSNKAEVTNMCITEYDEERAKQSFVEEGKAEGRAEGRADERKKLLDGVKSLIKDGVEKTLLFKTYDLTESEIAYCLS